MLSSVYTRFSKFVYQGTVGKDLIELNKYKTIDDIAIALGYTTNHEVEEDSQEHSEIIEKIQNFKSDFEQKLNNVENLSSSNISCKVLLTNTKEQLPVKDINEFGGKFAPAGSEVLMTYVGDLTSRSIDPDNSLGSGYYSRFDVLVVYSDGNNHYIKKVSVDVPWYANSTTESLYNHIFESKNYEIAKEKNTTKKNAIVVEPGKQNVQAYEAFETVNLNLFTKEVEFAR